MRSDQIVERAFRRQESIGWSNVARGRVVKGMIEVQEDWTGREERERGRKEDAKETVARALSYGMLFSNELWKLRCQEVMKKELPAEEKRIREQIAQLKERSTEVSIRDRKLFDERNAPSDGDSLDRMVQWVRSVENSIERMKKVENRGNRRMSEFMNFSGGERA